MIRRIREQDFHSVHAIINDAARAYRGVIPPDRWHEPYMSQEELRREIRAGVEFWGYEEQGELLGVMGRQRVRDATLIRHAYVKTARRRQGIGRALLAYLLAETPGTVLIGTWADAAWAVRFYEHNGFRRVSPGEKDRLLRAYWSIPERQIEVSVVLTNAPLPGAEPPENLAGLLRERLPRRQLELVRAAGEAADRLGLRAALVGGPVRDLLLGTGQHDLDVVVEGDARKYAGEVAARLQGRVRAHERFHTARIALPDGLRLDVAMARAETYAQPAALPRVRPAGLREDLLRRDFTLNAMALRINAGDFGRLVDVAGGRGDLAAGLIRILHPASFDDDPTRIFRAARYEQRFRFRLEPHTERRLRAAVRAGGVERLTPARVLAELLRVLEEERPAAVLRRLADFRALAGIHPALQRGALRASCCERLQAELDFAAPFLQSPADRVLARLLALLDGLTRGEAGEFSRRFPLARRAREVLRVQNAAGRAALKRLETGKALRASRLAVLLRPLPAEALLWTAARLKNRAAARGVRDYLARRDRVRTALTGRDLKQMGYAPGPGYERMLSALRAARWDGKVSDRSGEEKYVRRHFPLPAEKPRPRRPR